MLSKLKILYKPILSNIGRNNGNNIVVRMSHAANYRCAPASHSKATRIGAELVGAAMWWWVLWHLWHEPDHITGEFEYPDVKQWTNKELGIPS